MTLSQAMQTYLDDSSRCFGVCDPQQTDVQSAECLIPIDKQGVLMCNYRSTDI